MEAVTADAGNMTKILLLMQSNCSPAVRQKQKNSVCSKPNFKNVKDKNTLIECKVPEFKILGVQAANFKLWECKVQNPVIWGMQSAKIKFLTENFTTNDGQELVCIRF
ncbi:hypothetical protein KSP39_PZI016237 [Platanthera zijinensis]|uniref:Uncharacterized protein n=1 Tax=Platanthera zijinensis TaxID=2320716 RepID=A0AAP0B6M9_9ASPA